MPNGAKVGKIAWRFTGCSYFTAIVDMLSQIISKFDAC
jgi:hypothetical protein